MKTILLLLAIFTILPAIASAQDDNTVAPWRIEAEDYCVGAGIKSDVTALGGKAVFSNAMTDIDGIPFPRTSRSVTVHIKVKPGSTKETYRICSAARQIAASVKPEKSGIWQWLRFSGLHSSKIGSSFGLEYIPDPAAADKSAFIDSIVVSTRGDLSDSELDKAPLLFPGRPFTVATRCSQPPVLDGKGDDLCWKDAIACTDFLLDNTETKAAGQTSVRFCHDDTNLYALFICSEPILDPVIQRLHEFSVKVKDRDGAVMQDDCVAMIIKPNPSSKDAYDFFANALASINDAHCLTSDLWATRDSSWNMNAQASASIGNGQWSLEIALPFADLAKRQPAVGEDWQICIGRAALARNEITSWNPSFTGLHRPKDMGILRFIDKSCGVELHMPDALEPGKNTVPVVISSSEKSPGGAYITTTIAGQSGIKHSYCLTTPGAAKASDSEFRVQQTGDLTVAYGVLDAATCQPLYLTPAINYTVSGSLSTVSIKSNGPYELFLNGDLVSKGQTGSGDAVRVSLRKGVNAFAVKLDKGTADIKISAPGIDPTNQTWKIAPPDVIDPVNPETDDSDWKIAPVTNGLLAVENGKQAVLRHTVLIDKTLVWPAPLPALYICKGATQQLTINIGRIEHRRLTDWSIYVAVPAGFKIIGCNGYGDIHSMTTVGESKIDGQSMTVYKVVPKKLTVPATADQASGVLFFVRCQQNIKSDKATFFYWVSANGGTVSELRHSISVRILSALNGRQPKKLQMVLCGMFSELGDPALREVIARTAKVSGFNNCLTESVDMRFVLEKYGISNTTYLSFDGIYNRGIPKFTEYLVAHPDERLIRADGSASDRCLCTTLALDKSAGALKYMIELLVGDCRTGSILYDFEYPPFKGPHVCFCERCLAAFRQYAGLPADVQLNGDILKDKYSAKWIDFVAYRNAEVFLRIKEILHSIAPRIKFWVYSGYQSDDTTASYGVSWAYIGKLKACDVASMGYGRPVSEIAATQASLKDIPTVFGCLLIPYTADDYSPSTQIFKAEMLRRILDSRGGILFWQRDSMDGRTWLASAETSRLLAAYEDTFLKGKLTSIDNQEQSAVQLLTNGKTKLLCIMNPGNNAAEYNIKIPGTKGKWKEFYTGRTIDSGKTSTITVRANDTAVYVNYEIVD